MYPLMDDDPMLLESRLPYPKTLDKAVLVARGKGIWEVPLSVNPLHKNATGADSGYMEVRGSGEAPSENTMFGSQAG